MVALIWSPPIAFSHLGEFALILSAFEVGTFVAMSTLELSPRANRPRDPSSLEDSMQKHDGWADRRVRVHQRIRRTGMTRRVRMMLVFNVNVWIRFGSLHKSLRDFDAESRQP